MRSINMKVIDSDIKPSCLLPFILKLSILFYHKITKEHTNYVSMCSVNDNIALSFISHYSMLPVYSEKWQHWYEEVHTNTNFNEHSYWLRPIG